MLTNERLLILYWRLLLPESTVYSNHQISSAGHCDHLLLLCFQASCDIHDACYGVKDRSRSSCDADFYINMVRQCKSENWPFGCYTLAGTAYSGVSVDPTGDATNGYNWGQANPCM